MDATFLCIKKFSRWWVIAFGLNCVQMMQNVNIQFVDFVQAVTKSLRFYCGMVPTRMPQTLTYGRPFFMLQEKVNSIILFQILSFKEKCAIDVNSSLQFELNAHLRLIYL